MMKILNLGSRILVVSALLVGCAAKPPTKAEQAALDNRQLVFETCEKFMTNSDALVFDLRAPSGINEILIPIVGDFYKASEADQMNKEYRKAYSLLDDNSGMLSYAELYAKNDKVWGSDEDYKQFSENLSEVRIFCIDFIQTNTK